MPVSYAIPPWVGRPADPAAHYAQGFQIGVHLGAQQAAQMFQQQQMAMQHQKELMAEQQQEVENQYNTQVLNLKAAELARKHQANQIFQSRIASGEDPSQVLMQLAPELGESATSVLHNQALREQARAMMGYRERNLERMTQADVERSRPKPLAVERERQNLVDLQRQASELETALKANPGREDLKSRQQDVVNQIQAWYTQHPGGQQISLTTDASGNVQVQMGPGKVQPGAQSRMQENLADLKKSIVQIDRAKSQMTEKDVGVAGTVWDEVLNKWVSQAVPEAGDPSVSGNRVLLQKAADSYLQTQTAKGRLSAAERDDIRNALVTRKPGESFTRAQGVLEAMSRIQKFDAIAVAKTGQQKLESWMFDGLSQTEIRQLMKEGVLTPTEALEWAKRAAKR